MKKIRLGIIGAGRIGRVHAQSIKTGIPEAEIAIISDPFPGAAQKAAEEFNIPRYCEDYKEVLADPTINAVLVCTPSKTHAEITMAAARAGKHIFCEKPVDIEIDRILEIKRVIDETGVKMQVGFNRRFDDNFSKINRMVHSGELGEIQIVKITSRDPEPPSMEYTASSGGLFLDMTIHDFDMAYFQAGSEIDEVFAVGAVTVNPDLKKIDDIDTAAIILRFENGALGIIDNCRKSAYGYDQRVEVFGTAGAAEAENVRETNVKISTNEAVCYDKPLFFFLERYMGSFKNELKAFVDAVINDTPVPVTVEDGLRPILIANAANISRKENRPVKISEIRKGHEIG